MTILVLADFMRVKNSLGIYDLSTHSLIRVGISKLVGNWNIPQDIEI
jgi:hypothetical protein